MAASMPSPPLEQVLGSCWDLLLRGAGDSQHSTRTPTLISIDSDGSPSARTVVLRDCRPLDRSLRFHTDLRSMKVDQITREPRAAVHIYDQPTKTQLRLSCRCSVVTNGPRVEAAWAQTPDFSRQCYRSSLVPGAAITAPDDVAFLQDGEESGRENFAIIHSVVHEIQWLHLDADGHRHARFTWAGERWQMTWQAP